MVGGLKFENKPLTIRWYLLTTGYTTFVDPVILAKQTYYCICFMSC